jgi:hypothetical protein
MAIKPENIMNAKFETFFVKALSSAKIEELINTYRKKHFSAKKHVQMGDVEFDVVVKQGDKNIAFEIRVLPISQPELSEIDKYHKKAKALGYDFRLITVAKPKKSTIEIAWLEKALLKYFADHPIDTGSIGVDYQDIETAIQSISITGSQARVYLDGNLSVREHSGHNLISEILPFQGKLSLNLSEHM